jgi:hypothetical protein
MQQRGFIFMPYISGFTNFVNSLELEHSRHVVKELLETIIDANEMDLKISEVEGDAPDDKRDKYNNDFTLYHIDKLFLNSTFSYLSKVPFGLITKK